MPITISKKGGRPQATGELDQEQIMTLEEHANSARNMPLVTAKEARKAGLTFYWTGTPCAKGHYAKRRVKGSGCTACLYLNNLRTNELMNARRSQVRKEIREEQRAEAEIPKLGPPERSQVLQVYAESCDLETAASSIGLTLAELNVQISRSAQFATQILALEKRMRTSGVVFQYVIRDIAWTSKKKELLIRAFVDTGDIAAARDAIGASATNLHDELEADPEFAKALKEAEPKATQVLEEKAIQMALRGDDKLLIAVLKAKKPEMYTDKLKLDQTTTIRLSDEQLNEKIGRLVGKYKVIDAEFTTVGSDASEGKGGASQITGGTRVAEDPQQVPLYLPRHGTTVSG